MREIRTSGSMSGDGKRSVAAWPKLPGPSGGSLQSSVSSVMESAADKKCSHRVRLSITQKRKQIQQSLAEDYQKRTKNKASHLIEHRDHIALISSPDESFF
jgi:hypothetical protein